MKPSKMNLVRLTVKQLAKKVRSQHPKQLRMRLRAMQRDAIMRYGR